MMDAMTIKSSVKNLLESFNDENGQSEQVYYAAKALLIEVCGDKAGEQFGQSINATDGQYYWRTPDAMKAFIDAYFQ